LIETAGDERELEVARHDADDDIRLAVEQDLVAEDAGIAMEAALPHVIADDRDGCVSIVLLLHEDSAHRRRDSERGEDACRHPRGVHHYRLAAAGKLVATSGVASEGTKARRVMQIGAYFGCGDACIRDRSFCAQAVADADEARRIVEGQRPQQNAFHQGEDGRSGADAEREREHNRKRKAGSAAQLAHRETQVQQQTVHGDLLQIPSASDKATGLPKSVA
jgi:hypothetical protein